MREKIFAYLRVSGKHQIGGHGFDRQLKTIKKFCDRSGYRIDRVFKEQVSGTKNEVHRPVFNEMVEEILSNSVHIVIVESLDRLAREYRIQETLLIYLASKGVTLIAANTGEDITAAMQEDPMKRALIQIQGVFAELDKRQLSLRLYKGRRKKREEENWKEGPKPYGQHPDHPKEKETLRKIAYMRRRTSKDKSPRTFQSIADQLNKEGIKTRSGREWSASLVCNILRKSRERRSRG